MHVKSVQNLPELISLDATVYYWLEIMPLLSTSLVLVKKKVENHSKFGLWEKFGCSVSKYVTICKFCLNYIWLKFYPVKLLELLLWLKIDTINFGLHQSLRPRWPTSRTLLSASQQRHTPCNISRSDSALNKKVNLLFETHYRFLRARSELFADFEPTID